MHPIIFHSGPITIYSFGLCFMTALIVGSFTYWRLLKERIVFDEKIFDSLLLALVGGFVGARLGYVLLHWPVFQKHFFGIFDIVHYPGFIYYTGVLGLVAGVYFYAKKQKLKLSSMFDCLAISVSLSHVIGLIGAFLAGSGYGRVTNGWWGIMVVGFPEKRVPVQLLEAFVELVIFIFLITWYRRRKLSGRLLYVYATAYATTRMLLELLRGDSVYWFGVKSMIIVSLLVCLTLMLYWIKLIAKRPRRSKSFYETITTSSNN